MIIMVNVEEEEILTLLHETGFHLENILGILKNR